MPPEMNSRINLKSPIFKILFMFLSWRIVLLLIAYFAVLLIPLGSKDRYLGGGMINYQLFPQLFAWANFDGEHYLSIAIFGYKSLQQAFFPVYPLLISFFSNPNPNNLLSSLINSTVVGLIISNSCFILALIFIWELIKIDYSKKIAYLTIILIIVFPTSFYFGSLYSESFFLLMSVLSFYFARKGLWFYAGIFGAISTATRIFGIFLLPALLIEARMQKISLSKMIWIFMIPLGMGSYMWFLNSTIGDPVAFYHLQKIVGEQHQSGIILLPQVYFRYIKMIATTNINNPIFQTIVLELITGLLFLILPVYGYFKKIRFSYLIYAMLSFLTPTVQGSFSSTPRYVIVLFPAFLAAALWIDRLPILFRIVIIFFSAIALFVETALFLRGYWVA